MVLLIPFLRGFLSLFFAYYGISNVRYYCSRAAKKNLKSKILDNINFSKSSGALYVVIFKISWKFSYDILREVALIYFKSQFHSKEWKFGKKWRKWIFRFLSPIFHRKMKNLPKMKIFVFHWKPYWWSNLNHHKSYFIKIIMW